MDIEKRFTDLRSRNWTNCWEETQFWKLTTNNEADNDSTKNMTVKGFLSWQTEAIA